MYFHPLASLEALARIYNASLPDKDKNACVWLDCDEGQRKLVASSRPTSVEAHARPNEIVVLDAAANRVTA